MHSSDEESSSDESGFLTTKRRFPALPLAITSTSEEIETDEENETSSSNSNSSDEEVNIIQTNEWIPIDADIPDNETMWSDELLVNDVDCDNPSSLYKLFITDSVLEQIVVETNRYAIQRQSDSIEDAGIRKHQKIWKPVTLEEIRKFIGILLISGITQVPEIRLYWSKNKMYTNLRIQEQMTRDRFLIILKYLHFTDNTTNTSENRLYKFLKIMNEIVNNFKTVLKPGKEIVIDETMIPWRGRLRFRQYVPGKRHKYGIKMYKLCVPGGYTYNLEVYAGKNGETIKVGHSHDVVMRLMDGMLDKRRILYTDSYYTSVPLAEELLKKSTFLCGTIKPNRKFLPLEAKTKQKRGTSLSAKNRQGIKFVKWTDKRTVCMLTSRKKHSCAIIEDRRGKRKPDVVIDYNNAKKGVDLSDQLASYYNCLRKTIKWYKKIMVELICGTSIANAWYIHQKFGSKKMDLLKFREMIIDQLLQDNVTVAQHTKQHFIETLPGTSRKDRKRCKECYKKISQTEGPVVAAKKTKRVMTFCAQCVEKPSLCISCFQDVHK